MALVGLVRRHGVLPTLLVRAGRDDYEVLWGSSWLNAAKVAGFTRVPCQVCEVDDEDARDAGGAGGVGTTVARVRVRGGRRPGARRGIDAGRGVREPLGRGLVLGTDGAGGGPSLPRDRAGDHPDGGAARRVARGWTPDAGRPGRRGQDAAQPGHPARAGVRGDPGRAAADPGQAPGEPVPGLGPGGGGRAPRRARPSPGRCPRCSRWCAASPRRVVKCEVVTVEDGAEVTFFQELVPVLPGLLDRFFDPRFDERRGGPCRRRRAGRRPARPRAARGAGPGAGPRAGRLSDDLAFPILARVSVSPR